MRSKNLTSYVKFRLLYEEELTSLVEKKEAGRIPESVRLDVSEEFTRLLKQTDFGIKSTEAVEIQFSDENFEKFCIDFRKYFPVLFQILHTLFPVDVNEYTRRKKLSRIHALSLLSSLQNLHAPNDMRLMFAILLLSFGVGCRLMNMLC